MKKLLSTLVVTTACSLAAATAGTPAVDYTKQMETPMVETRIGMGFYAAAFGGANVHQSADIDSDDDFDIDLDLDEDTGWFAGLKLGYVFDTGSFLLPAIELEGFYNTVDLKVRAESDDFDVDSTIAGDLDQIVLQLNFLLKFDVGPFRPYIGAGAGAAYLELDDVRGEVRFEDGVVEFEEGADAGDFGVDNDGWVFAYQGIAGFDYYFTDNFSVFAEYKALIFHSDDSDVENYIQHLVGGGVRFHF